MKWGVRKQKNQSISSRKQRRLQQKQNFKIVRDRVKKTGTILSDLHNRETGYLSNKKIKKKLGTDIKLSQVSDFYKYSRKRATQLTAAYTGVALAVAIAYNKLH